MTRPVRVGIIGANARGGWAGESHVLAVQGLGGLELTAVATNSKETAIEAAQAFGVSKAYGDGAELIKDEDLVTVATRVPDHRALVLAAIAAGKHVYTEWPLGPSKTDSEDMARAAQVADVHHAIDLQLRQNPAVKTMQDRLSSESIGRVLSLSASSSTAGFGPDVPTPFVYLEDPASFANLVTIQGAHTLDLLIALAGPFETISALGSRQFPLIMTGDEKVQADRRTFDHLLVQGRFESGAPFTVEVAGGRKGHAPFWLEIVGEDGTLRLEGGNPRGLQAGRIALIENGTRVTVDEGELSSLPDSALNVGGVYAALRDDIVAGTSKVTGFNHAANLASMIEDVLAAPDNQRQLAKQEWPSK